MQILCKFNAPQFLWRADHKWLIWVTSVENDLASYAQDEFTSIQKLEIEKNFGLSNNWPWRFIQWYFQRNGEWKDILIWHDSSKPHWLGRTSSGYPSCFLGHTPLLRTGSTPQQGGAFPGRRSAAQIAWEKPMWININTQRTLLYYHCPIVTSTHQAGRDMM